MLPFLLLSNLPSERSLCLLVTSRTLSVIQVRRDVRGVKHLMEPILSALWTLVPALGEFRVFNFDRD